MTLPPAGVANGTFGTAMNVVVTTDSILQGTTTPGTVWGFATGVAIGTLKLPIRTDNLGRPPGHLFCKCRLGEGVRPSGTDTSFFTHQVTRATMTKIFAASSIWEGTTSIRTFGYWTACFSIITPRFVIGADNEAGRHVA